MPLFMRNPTKVEAFQMVQGKPFPAFIEAAIAARDLSYSLSNGMMDGSVWNQPSLAWLKFKEGDYIVHNGPHDLYVVGKDQFEKTYTAASEPAKEEVKPAPAPASAPAKSSSSSSAPQSSPASTSKSESTSASPAPSPVKAPKATTEPSAPASTAKPLAGKK